MDHASPSEKDEQRTTDRIADSQQKLTKLRAHGLKLSHVANLTSDVIVHSINTANTDTFTTLTTQPVNLHLQSWHQLERYACWTSQQDAAIAVHGERVLREAFMTLGARYTDGQRNEATLAQLNARAEADGEGATVDVCQEKVRQWVQVCAITRRNIEVQAEKAAEAIELLRDGFRVSGVGGEQGGKGEGPEE